MDLFERRSFPVFSCSLSWVETFLLSRIALELNGRGGIGGCAAFCSSENVEKYAASKPTFLFCVQAGKRQYTLERCLGTDWERKLTAGAFLQLLFSRFSNCVTTLIFFNIDIRNANDSIILLDRIILGILNDVNKL